LVDIIPGTGTDLNKALESNDMQMDMGFIWDGDPTEDKEEKLGGSTIF
jgi:hypothetical protein